MILVYILESWKKSTNVFHKQMIRKFPTIVFYFISFYFILFIFVILILLFLADFKLENEIWDGNVQMICSCEALVDFFSDSRHSYFVLLSVMSTVKFSLRNSANILSFG